MYVLFMYFNLILLLLPIFTLSLISNSWIIDFIFSRKIFLLLFCLNEISSLISSYSSEKYVQNRGFLSINLSVCYMFEDISFRTNILYNNLIIY